MTSTLPSTMTSFYLLFLAVNAGDLLLTLNGLRIGFLREANPFLTGVAFHWNLNLVAVMTISKILAASLAFWLAFLLPNQLRHRRTLCNLPASPASLPPEERVPAIILLALAIITGLLGILPAISGHVRHYLSG